MYVFTGNILILFSETNVNLSLFSLVLLLPADLNEPNPNVSIFTDKTYPDRTENITTH